MGSSKNFFVARFEPVLPEVYWSAELLGPRDTDLMFNFVSGNRRVAFLGTRECRAIVFAEAGCVFAHFRARRFCCDERIEIGTKYRIKGR